MSNLDGIVLGRFQPLHLGHIEYLQAAKARCMRLFVGVTNPDVESQIYNDADPRRSISANNPYSYLERHLMIEDALRGLGWKYSDFCVIPIPLLSPERLTSYLPAPRSTVAYLTVYDEWGDQKVSLMRERGYQTDVMWRRDHSERFTSGTVVRSLIRSGQPWRHLVPDEIAHHVDALGVIDNVN